MTLDEMIARCKVLAPDFVLEEEPWTDPRTPDVSETKIAAKCELDGKPYVLELLTHAGLTKAAALACVVEGAMRTLERRRGRGRGV